MSGIGAAFWAASFSAVSWLMEIAEEGADLVGLGDVEGGVQVKGL